MTFSAEQMLALFQLMQQNAGHGPPAVPAVPATAVTAQSFPAFVAPAPVAHTGKSLLDWFPTTEGSMLLNIAKHDFKPSDLYKLDSKFRDKAERSILTIDGDNVRLCGDPTAKDYPSLNAILPPLTL